MQPQCGCPYLVIDILALEKVQRKASRLSLGQKRGEMEYVERIKIFELAHLREAETLHFTYRMF